MTPPNAIKNIKSGSSFSLSGVYPFIAKAKRIDVATSAIIKWYRSLYEVGVGVGGFHMCWMMSQGCVVPAPAIKYLPRLVIFVTA